MSHSIFEDASARPNLFHWFGIDDSEFDSWLSELEMQVHPDLVSFWRRTGGGDLFESETMLGPLASDDHDNLLNVNQFHWERGLPRSLFLFHTGFCYSASFVDWPRQRNWIVTLRIDSYDIERSFDTFNSWYTNRLRAEYWERYSP